MAAVMAALTLGASRQAIDDPAGLVGWYLDERNVRHGGHFYRETRRDDGSALTCRSFVVSLLVAGGHVALRARSFQANADSFDLAGVPAVSLAEANEGQLGQIAEAIEEVARWPGFGTSTASKLLHAARPQTVPVLDREAIGGAYLRPEWTGVRIVRRPVLYAELVPALRVYVTDLAAGRNQPAWRLLEKHTEGRYSRLQLLDMVWWSHYRQGRGRIG